MEKLKPCPFCGETNVEVRTDDNGLSWYVFCKECGLVCGFSVSKESVEKGWNMRAQAIPIEWIDGWLKTHIPHDNDGMPYIADVYEMLADWEKENETH